MPPLVWLSLFLLGVVGAAWAFPKTRIDLPAQTALAALLVLAGFGVAVAGVVAFRRHRTTVNPHAIETASALVTDSVFAVTRNPMYVGMALVLLGVALGTGSLIAVSLVPVFILALTEFQIRPEEIAMRRRFGSAYDDYAARTPRWLLV